MLPHTWSRMDQWFLPLYYWEVTHCAHVSQVGSLFSSYTFYFYAYHFLISAEYKPNKQEISFGFLQKNDLSYFPHVRRVKLATNMYRETIKGLNAIEQRFPTSLLRTFLKHGTPDYVVRGTDLFSLRLSIKQNDSSQHNNSYLVWMDQNHTYFFCQIGNNFHVLRNFSN